MTNLNIPEGMYFFEYILLLLGILFFIVLLIILIIFAVKSSPLKQLLLFFAFPIVMIGYPSIQKISIDKEGISVEKNSIKLTQNPQDSTARNELEHSLAKIEKRPVKNPQILVNIGKGHAALGDTIKALDAVDKALDADVNFDKAQTLKQQWNTPGVQFDKLTQEVKNNPDNQEAREELEQKITDFERTPATNNISINRILNSSVALGDTARVLQYVDSLRVETPVQRQRVNDLRSMYTRRSFNQ